MAKPLKERIQSALKPSSRVATIEELIGELPGEIAELRSRLEQATSDSLNMMLQDADQDEAAALAKQLGRDLARLEFALEQLSTVKEERIKSDRAKEILAAYEAAESNRDAIAIDLANFWHAEIPKLLGILQRMRDSDEEIERVNRFCPGNKSPLNTVEVKARGVENLTNSRGGELYYIGKMRIPTWESFISISWPPPPPRHAR